MNNKYKILIIEPAFGKSIVGAGRFIEQLYKKSKHDISVMAENGHEDITYNIPIKLNYFQRKLSMLARAKPYQNALIKVRHKYDLVIFNNPLLAHNYTSISRKYVVFVHDYNYFNPIREGIKQTVLNMLYFIILQKSLNKAPKIILNSTYLQKQMLKNYPNLSPHQLEILYQGINLQDYKPKSQPQNLSTSITILYIKTDWRRGRIIDLIQALSRLESYSFKLTICGVIPDYAFPNVSNITYNVMGPTKHSEIIKLYQTHDIFCVPVTSEALGVANMEAMASGIPIVTTKVGGIPEVIGDGAFYCEPKNVESIKIALKHCIENPELRNEKVKANLERVQRFSVDTTIENFDNMVSNFIEKESL